MRKHMGLFRGKYPNGMWVYGSLAVFRNIKNEPYTAIIPVEDGENQIRKLTRIDPDTVGECTGFKDKNGKLMFEGDICRACLNPEICTAVVKYRNDIASFVLMCDKDTMLLLTDMRVAKNRVGDAVWVEVVGNIHDNPELLERRED